MSSSEDQGVPPGSIIDKPGNQRDDDDLRATATMAVRSQETTNLAVMMRVDSCLFQLSTQAGFAGAAMLDYDTGRLLGKIDGPPGAIDIERAAFAYSHVIAAKFDALHELGLEDAIEDVVISDSNRYLLMRTLPAYPSVFILLVLDRDAATLTQTRMKVAELALGFS